MHSVTVKLKFPVELGSETVEELVLKPNSRLYKDVALEGGNGSITFKPYPLAVVGVQLAGRTAAAHVVDKMHPSDMMRVAEAVMGFLSPDPATGDATSL
jgi:hypothetical protein